MVLLCLLPSLICPKWWSRRIEIRTRLLLSFALSQFSYDKLHSKEKGTKKSWSLTVPVIDQMEETVQLECMPQVEEMRDSFDDFFNF